VSLHVSFYLGDLITSSEQEGVCSYLAACRSLELTGIYFSGGGQQLYYNPQPPSAPCSAMLRYYHVIGIYSDSLLHLEVSPSKPTGWRCLLNHDLTKDLTFPLEMPHGYDIQIHLQCFLRIIVVVVSKVLF